MKTRGNAHFFKEETGYTLCIHLPVLAHLDCLSTCGTTAELLHLCRNYQGQNWQEEVSFWIYNIICKFKLMSILSHGYLNKMTMNNPC